MMVKKKKDQGLNTTLIYLANEIGKMLLFLPPGKTSL